MSKKRQQSGGKPVGFAKGQLWKLNHLYVQVVDQGKKLIHYRMLNDVKDPGARIKTSEADVMWGYLKSRGARLVHGDSPN
jgi:hypothetical protein